MRDVIEFELTLHLARRVYASIRANRAAYEADVADWYENGDGAKPNWVYAHTQEWFDPEWDNPHRMVNLGGLGHRYPRCIHGSSLITDYDNICGGCEDSISDSREAVEIASGLVREFNRRLAWIRDAPQNMPQQLRSDLWEWVAEPTNRYPKV